VGRRSEGDILDRLTSLEEVEPTAEDDKQLAHFLSWSGEFAKGGNRCLKLIGCKIEKELDENSLNKTKETILEVENSRRSGQRWQRHENDVGLRCNGISVVVIVKSGEGEDMRQRRISMGL
jgi:hypothetical protein